MYTADDIQNFLSQVHELLLMETDDLDEQHAGAILLKLKDVINFNDYRYYVAAEPLISDYDYDRLFRLLKSIEQKYPALITVDSPTQRVALGLTKNFPLVNHLVPMLSLENSYNEGDIFDFDRKARELSGHNHLTYSVEPKYDGSGISLVYEDDMLIRGVTRGDGIMGENVTPNIKRIRSVPLKAPFSKYGIQSIEIRGEVMISKKAFEAFNRQREEAGLERLANPRNSAAGSLRLQDSIEVARRNMDAVLYHISYAVDKAGNDLLGERFQSRYENIRMLHALGFKVPYKEQKPCSSIQEVMAYLNEWENQRDEYAYEIDGMVIKVDNIAIEDRLGATSHHPRWAIAYKFKPRQAHTIIETIVFQVGRIGNITPVAKLKPVSVGGVTVSSVSLFNEDFIGELDLRLGDEVLVERAGDVIPYIAGVVKEHRKGTEQRVIFPIHCPACQSALVRAEEEAAWRCVNVQCPEQIYGRLVHFVSRNAMDITGLGKAIIDRFIAQKWLSTIVDIYTLPFEEIARIEGFGEKSVEKLKFSIEKSKKQSLARLLFGLGIRYVGETTAKNIAAAINCLKDLESWTIAQLLELPEVGEKVAQSIYDYFQDVTNQGMISALAAAGVSIRKEEQKMERVEAQGRAALQGQIFLFTGALEKYTRPQATEIVEALGGRVANALSSKVNFLVAGNEAGSKLEKAKKLPGVKIISEAEFESIISE